jgi:hypothetical protein
MAISLVLSKYIRRHHHLDQPHLRRPPPAVRFQAEQSNDCWQFDLSPSDLKHIERPEWVASST